jgi:hypothetical protein
MSREAYAPIKKMFYDGMHALRLAIYLKAPVVRHYLRDAIVSAGSWAIASAKRKGRCITDCSFAGKGNTPLKTPVVVKSACDDFWGNLKLPVVGDYVWMVLAFLDEKRVLEPSLGLDNFHGFEGSRYSTELCRERRASHGGRIVEGYFDLPLL